MSSTKLIHSKTAFRKEFRYIREAMRLSEDLMANERWEEMEQMWQEVAALACEMEQWSQENNAGESFDERLERLKREWNQS